MVNLHVKLNVHSSNSKQIIGLRVDDNSDNNKICSVNLRKKSFVWLCKGNKFAPVVKLIMSFNVTSMVSHCYTFSQFKFNFKYEVLVKPSSAW